MFKKIFKFGCLPLAIIFFGLIVNVVCCKPFSIKIFYERVFIEFAMQDPELLSSIGLMEGLGMYGHNAELSDESDAHLQLMMEKARKDLATLRSYNREGRDEQGKLSYDILEWFLNNNVEGEKYVYHNYPVNQLFGVQNGFPTFMATTHRITDERGAGHYIERLSKVGIKFDQVLEGLKIREDKGIIPPKFVIERVLNEMSDFVNNGTESNILYQSFVERVDTLNDIDSEKKQELYTNVKNEIGQTVFPAYESLINYFKNLQNKATTDDGVWKLPDGDNYYKFALKENTTLDLDPDEVHDLGLSEVDRVLGEMKSILDSLGYHPDSTVASHLKVLATDSTFLYPNNDAGVKQCIADYQSIIDDIDTKLQKMDLFGLHPSQKVQVKRIPVFKEKTAPGAYYDPPSMDGSRPGIFYANMRDMTEIPKWGMKTLAYHEAVPGHHFQLTIAQELEGLPTFRTIIPFTSYAEGWALYTEYLAWEYGFHADPYDNLGRLQAELFRAVRLVVDSGIHAKKWTREQAITYMYDTTGMPYGDVVAEIERYIVMPGQACAYKIGMITILELREKAKKELGEQFSIKEFHDLILGNGAMPLELMERVVDEYIEKKK